MKFEIAYSPWPMFVDYVNQTWIIPHKERFVKAWMNKVMHLGNTITNRYENCKPFLLFRIYDLMDKNNFFCLLVCVFQMQG